MSSNTEILSKKVGKIDVSMKNLEKMLHE